MGKRNERYELAKVLAEEFGNPRTTTMFLKHFGQVEHAGVDLDIAIACWRDLRLPRGHPDKVSREGDVTWTLYSVLGGPDGGRVEQYQKAIVAGVPPVYDAYNHDEYVVRHADVLKAAGWRYQAGRLDVERIKELGL